MKKKPQAIHGALTMGHMVIGKPKSSSESVLKDAPREGFTKYAARFFNTVIPVDDVTETEARVMQARMDFAATIAAMQSGKSTPAIRRAVVVSRN